VALLAEGGSMTGEIWIKPDASPRSPTDLKLHPPPLPRLLNAGMVPTRRPGAVGRRGAHQQGWPMVSSARGPERSQQPGSRGRQSSACSGSSQRPVGIHLPSRVQARAPQPGGRSGSVQSADDRQAKQQPRSRPGERGGTQWRTEFDPAAIRPLDSIVDALRRRVPGN